jgi:formylmethanofuran dehydrogenase subunit E
VCAECGEHIQDEYMYVIDGKNICPSCLEDYREWID